MVTNPYLIAIAIPLALLACGSLLKKIVRGGGWKRADFFLGAELALAAIGSAMVYLYDLRDATTGSDDERWRHVAATASFIVISFFLLLFIMSTHQDWEHRTGNRRGQVIWLGIICNTLGVMLFSSFVLLVKGVK
jgi:hypothetical protein